MGPFGQQPDVKILQQRTKAIGIVNQVLLTVPDNGKLITKRIFTAGHDAREEATRVEAFQITYLAAGFGFDNPHFCCIR